VEFAVAFNAAVDGIGDANLRNSFRTQMIDLTDLEADYRARAGQSALFSLPRVLAKLGADPLVRGTLRKSDLTGLYSQYFAGKGKPARLIYDQLKVTSKGKCPFCGDLGHVRTLDHYIPKANFPLHSVLPLNLVPCCRDCNTEKLGGFPTALETQPLHPYFDDDKFFIEKWVEARVIPGAPPVIEFFVSPPTQWHDHEKSRVAHHFECYDLATRFGTEAGSDLSEVITTRRTTLKDDTPVAFSQYLSEKSNNLSLPTNNWRRVMFNALANDQWFCSHFHPM
jgi:hypothetical protein